jgi:hypothetical protein
MYVPVDTETSPQADTVDMMMLKRIGDTAD